MSAQHTGGWDQLPALDKKAPALRMEPPRIMAAKRVLEHVAR